MITQTINLNLIPGSVYPRINVSQYDKGSRTLNFNLYNGSVAFEVPEDSTVTIQGTKADLTGFQYECTYDGSVVTADLEEQMTIYEGDVTCEIVITNNLNILGTSNFILHVEPAALSDDTVISDTDLPLLQEAVEAAAEAEASATAAASSESAAAASESAAEDSAEDAEAYAVGTRNGTDVTSDDPAYHNNAKYYAESVSSAIEDLDVTDTAVSGSYVTAVSETDGKIAVTREAADNTPTASSSKMVTSDGIKSYVDDSIAALDVSDSAVAGSYVTAVSETDGVISVTREAADATPTEDSTAMVTSDGIYAALSAKQDTLTFDATPTEDSTNPVTSGGVYTALEDKVDCTTVSDEYNSSTTYAVGDHFIYENTIYEVIVACTGITPPNTSYYTAYTITELIEANTSQIADLTTTSDIASGITDISSKLTYSVALKQCGKVVQFRLYISSLSATTAWSETIMQLPVLPAVEVYMADQNGRNSYPLVLRTTGIINTSNTAAIGSGQYCATFLID